MISVVAILTKTGEVIARFDYRDCAVDDNALMSAFGAMTFQQPFCQNGTYYYHLRRNDICLMAATSMAQSMVTLGVVEALMRLYNVCKDFFGNVSEESLKSNRVLLYELLSEFMDYGYVQLCSADKLRPHIYSTAAAPSRDDPISVHRSLLGLTKTVESLRRAPPALEQKRLNDVYVDVVENINVVVKRDGSILTSYLSGRLAIRSFVPGNPLVSIFLNDDLGIISSSTGNDPAVGLSGVCLDGCDFGDLVDVEEFSSKKVLKWQHRFGEDVLMNYRMDEVPPLSQPFKLQHAVSVPPDSTDLDVQLTLRCQVPSNAKAVRVQVQLPLPKTTSTVMSQLSGVLEQSIEPDVSNSTIRWKMRDFAGGATATAKLKLVDGNVHRGSRLQLGPLAVDFELSAFSCSGLRVRSVHLGGGSLAGQSEVSKWVRYVVYSNAYVFRLH